MFYYDFMMRTMIKTRIVKNRYFRCRHQIREPITLNDYLLLFIGVGRRTLPGLHA